MKSANVLPRSSLVSMYATTQTSQKSEKNAGLVSKSVYILMNSLITILLVVTSCQNPSEQKNMQSPELPSGGACVDAVNREISDNPATSESKYVKLAEVVCNKGYVVIKSNCNGAAQAFSNNLLGKFMAEESICKSDLEKARETAKNVKGVKGVDVQSYSLDGKKVLEKAKSLNK
jgi:hypothetical protein